MDTLAVRLTVPPVGSVEDFHQQVNAPCRAHKRKGRPEGRPSVLVPTSALGSRPRVALSSGRVKKSMRQMESEGKKAELTSGLRASMVRVPLE